MKEKINVSRKAILKHARAYKSLWTELILLCMCAAYFIVLPSANMRFDKVSLAIVSIVSVCTLIEITKDINVIAQILSGKYRIQSETITSLGPRHIRSNHTHSMSIGTCNHTIAATKDMVSKFNVGDEICLVFIGKEKYPSIIEKETALI